MQRRFSKRELADTIAAILVGVADGWQGGKGLSMSRWDDLDESDGAH